MTPNSPFILAFIALALLATPAVARESPGYSLTDHPSQDGRCRGDGGSGELDRSEKACLEQLSGIAMRQGATLHLTFQDGSSKVYANEREGCESTSGDCIEYKLTGYFPKHGLILIQIGYYEGAEWMLVRLDSGKETKIHEPPHYSPREKFLVSVCSSEGPSSCGNGIDIIATQPSKATRDWHYRPPDNSYELFEFVGWDGDARVKLTVTFRVGDDLKTQPASVDLIDGRWRLKMPKEYRRPAPATWMRNQQ
jgi:hypothetical protein